MPRTNILHFRPSLEALESRWMPAAFQWVLQGDGNFNDPGNWRDNFNRPGVPGAGDDAYIGGGVTVTSSVANTVNTVGGVHRLRVAAGTFAMNNFGKNSFLTNLVVDQGAMLQVSGGQTSIIGSEIAGTLNAAAGATLHFLREVNNLNAGAALTGPGQYLVTGDVFGGPTVNVNTDITAPARFLLQNGFLGGAGTLTIAGTFDWINDGFAATGMRGTGVTRVLAGATLNVGGLTVELATRTLDNFGTVNMSTTGNFQFSAAAVFINRAGAVFDIKSDGDIYSFVGFTETFRNLGTVRKSGGVDVTSIRATFENTATVDVQAGALSLLAANLTGGTYRTAANAVLDLTSGHLGSRLAGPFTAVGNGTVAIDGGSFTIGLAGATFNVPSTVSFRWSGGDVVVPVDTTLTYNGLLRLTGTGQMQLRGGGTMTVVGEVLHTGEGPFRIDWNSTQSTASTLNIPAGSTYTLASDADIIGSQGGVLNNAGSIRKAAGSATSEVNVALNSGGTIVSAAGTLSLRTVGGRLTGGTFNVATGAILDLTGGHAVEFAGTYTGGGNGEVRLASGVLRAVGGAAGVTFNFPAGLFHWRGGTLDTAGVNVTVQGGLTLNDAAGKSLAGNGSLNLSGTVTHLDTGNLILGGDVTVRIAAGGVYDIRSDADIQGNAVLANAGTLRKSGGTSETRIEARLNNTGLVEVRSGTLTATGVIDQVFSGRLLGGAWSVVSDATVESTLNLNTNLTSIGVGAGVALSGRNSTFTSLANLSSIAGSLTLRNGQTLTTAGALTNGGNLTLAPGGKLNVNGNFTQTATGRLAVQANLAAGLPVGRLTTTPAGRLTLGGKLAVTFLGTTRPGVGAQVLLADNTGSAAIRGIFAGLAEGGTMTVNGMRFRISYRGRTGNDVVLTRIS